MKLKKIPLPQRNAAKTASHFRNFIFLLPCFFAAGCTHAPNQDILGSFFPAWMLCAGLGILVAVIARLILAKAGIDAFLPAKLPVYGGLALGATLAFWLLWFGN